MPSPAPTTSPDAAPTSRWKGPVSRLVGLAVALLCLLIAMWGLDPAQLWAQLSVADPLLLFGAGLCALGISGIKGWKLRLLLAGEQRVPLRATVTAELLGVLADIILPMRLIEIIRALVLQRLARVPVGLVLGVQVIEVAVSLLFALGLGASLGLLLPAPAWLSQTMAVGAVVLLAIGATVTLLLLKPRLAELLEQHLQARGGPLFGPIARALETFVRGLRLVAMAPKLLAAVGGLTLLEWVLMAGTLGLAALAVGVQLTPLGVLVLLVANLLAFAIPSSTSGSIGTYELVAKLTLVGMAGLEPHSALAVVLAAHGTLLASGALGGLLALAASPLSLTELRRESASMAQERPQG